MELSSHSQKALEFQKEREDGTQLCYTMLTHCLHPCLYYVNECESLEANGHLPRILTSVLGSETPISSVQMEGL